MEINNEIYERLGGDWWKNDGDGNLVSLRFLTHPVKFEYLETIIQNQLQLYPKKLKVLDVGCGGGYLTEELAKINLDVTGVDPSIKSIEAARMQSKKA